MAETKITVDQYFEGDKTPEEMAEALRRLADSEGVLIVRNTEDSEEGFEQYDPDSMMEAIKGVGGTEKSESTAEMGNGETQFTAVLVVVITYADTDMQETDFTTYNVISDYIKLLKNTYPKPNGIVDVVGAKAGPGKNPREWQWLSQSDFFAALREGKENAEAFSERTDFFGYNQIHIIGHGWPTKGMVFRPEPGEEDEGDAGESEGGAAFSIDDVEAGGSSDVPLRFDGKVVILGCFTDVEGLYHWFKQNLEEGRGGGLSALEGAKTEEKEKVKRVHGVTEYGMVGYWTYPDGRKVPIWEWYEETRQIADFLGIELDPYKVLKAEEAGY
jgi:hypothetical protein